MEKKIPVNCFCLNRLSFKPFIVYNNESTKIRPNYSNYNIYTDNGCFG